MRVGGARPSPKVAVYSWVVRYTNPVSKNMYSVLHTTPISTLIPICTLCVYMWLGYSLHLWRSPTGCRPPPPTPLPLRVAKAGRNNLNNEITPLLPTWIGERYSQTISCADVNSPVNESAELTQGPSIVSSLLWALTYVHCSTLWASWQSSSSSLWSVHNRARIFKLIRSPRIDSKKPIPPGCVAWRAGTTTLFLLRS